MAQSEGELFRHLFIRRLRDVEELRGVRDDTSPHPYVFDPRGQSGQVEWQSRFRFDWKVTARPVQASGADETIRQEGRRNRHSQTRFECDRDRFAPNLTTFTGVCPNALERIVRRVTLAIERTGRLRVSPDLTRG